MHMYSPQIYDQFNDAYTSFVTYESWDNYGWYWQGKHGFQEASGQPMGPFHTEQEAIEHAKASLELY